MLHPRELAEHTAGFARFSDPQSILSAEGRVLESMARTVKQAGYDNLAVLLAQRPPQGMPLLVAAARYFFRRAVEEDAKLAQGLAFAQLEHLSKQQEEGFASLHAAMAQQGQRLEQMLADVHAVVLETHSAVLDLQGQIEGQSGQLQEIGVAVQKLLEQHQLHRREVRPGDSLSIRNDNERQLVKQLVARYRALPEADRRQVPALLNGIGKLEVVAGDFDAARKDFDAVATLVEDNKLQAEAYFNAYQACLERRDWPAAIGEFIKAVKLDAKRFASFPVGKYQPQRILGAGGFGVAFLCKHKYMDAQVVVKTLMLDDLGRDADKVFTEAQVLRQLDHPAIIRISDCGYVDAASKSRPFLVMDYFEGGTLEEHVKKHGPLTVEDVLAVARPVAEGLQAAHGKGILHRDVKPANLLVRKEDATWRIKVIDFGLALRQKVVQTTMSASTAKRNKTRVGESIAGTMDYAAPEQMGKRNDPVGPYSDVYGWAKMCCYALFQTTQPLLTHWQSIPLPLAQVLERCLSEDPKNRPQSFAEVLESLNAVSTPSGRERREAAAAPSFEFEEPAAETVKRKSSRTQRRKRERSKLPLVIGGGVALAVLALVLLFTVVLRSKTKAGTLVVEVDQPGAEVFVDGKQYTITQAGDKEPIQIEVQEGTRSLKVVKGGFETFTREFTVKSGGKETLRVRLEPIKVAAKDTKPTTLPERSAPAEKPQDKKGGWTSLFNGKDLTGWKVDSGKRDSWRVEQNEIVAEGEDWNTQGWLLTQRDYGDFVLRLEYLMTEGANSGVTFRMAPGEKFLKINLIDDEHRPEGLRKLDHRAGGLWWPGGGSGRAVDHVADLKPLGEWNRMEITARGRSLRIAVNDRETLNVLLDDLPASARDLPAVRNPSGRIGLQCHTGRIRFRNIELKELPSQGANRSQEKKDEWLSLFTGDASDLDNWLQQDNQPPRWKVTNGYLEVEPGTGGLRTRRVFARDHEIHVEFWVPLMPAAKGQARGNSGVFVQGRYEVQILDSYGVRQPNKGDCGGLYGLHAPRLNACKPPEQWQTFDITFRAPKIDDRGQILQKARITVVQNGEVVLDDVEIEKVCPGALDTNIGLPGPLLLQDHGNRIRFRTIKVKQLAQTGQAENKPREPVGEVRVFEGHHGGIWSVAVSPDGRYGLSGSGFCPRNPDTTDFTMRLWELATGKEVHCFRGHRDTVRNVAFSPDGKWGLSGSWDKTARLWDVASGKEIRCFEGHTDKVAGVAFFSDGKRIATCGSDHTIRLWDVETGKQLRRIEGKQPGFDCIAVLPDGRRIVSGGGSVGQDCAIRLWDLDTGEELRRFDGHDRVVHSIVVSPDGGRAVSGCANCNAIVWDIATAKAVHRFPGHCVCFSRDGRRLLEGSGNKIHNVSLYDTVDWKCLQTFTGHTDYVQGVAFTSDGHYALSGSWDGTLRLWRLPLEKERPPATKAPIGPALLKLKPGSLQGRIGPMRQDLLEQAGGNDRTEAAVIAGLKWLVRQQKPDGSWIIEGQDFGTGATGLGLLPLLGAGNTHQQGSYAKNVNMGLAYLLGKQKPDGSFAYKSLYEHAIATIAICEAYGMSRDQKLRLPAQRAIDFIVAAQHAGGGWRYEPRQPGDTSATGWHFMALKTGEMAGLRAPHDSMRRVADFLDGVATADGGYGYMGSPSSPSCTAIGLLCRQYLGGHPQKPEIVNGVKILMKHLPPRGGSSIYYYYYATQVMRHFGGDNWGDWNARIQEMLLPRQIASENAAERFQAGSWSPAGDDLAKQGGRLMVTSLSLLTLEVYYRHVPLFLSEPTKQE